MLRTRAGFLYVMLFFASSVALTVVYSLEGLTPVLAVSLMLAGAPILGCMALFTPQVRPMVSVIVW